MSQWNQYEGLLSFELKQKLLQTTRVKCHSKKKKKSPDSHNIQVQGSFTSGPVQWILLYLLPDGRRVNSTLINLFHHNRTCGGTNQRNAQRHNQVLIKNIISTFTY